MLLVSPGRARGCSSAPPTSYDPIALARRYLSDADIVLAEGFKHAPIPKIEVFRPSVSQTPLYDPDSPDRRPVGRRRDRRSRLRGPTAG